MLDSFKHSQTELNGLHNYIAEEKKKTSKTNINSKLCLVSDREDGGRKPF